MNIGKDLMVQVCTGIGLLTDMCLSDRVVVRKIIDDVRLGINTSVSSSTISVWRDSFRPRRRKIIPIKNRL
jgi:hypothetical protein